MEINKSEEEQDERNVINSRIAAYAVTRRIEFEEAKQLYRDRKIDLNEYISVVDYRARKERTVGM